MDNNTIQINSYLQNEMNADEKSAFEKRLAEDIELQREFKIQQQIISAAINAGMKAEFAKAIRQKTIIKRSFQWGIAASIIATTIILFNINSNKHVNEKQAIVKAEQPAINNKRPFINPPLANINVPLSEYSFDAEKGDVIYHSTGSVIYFPPAALVDAFGNIVKGMVTVTYREFADPIDFFVSGIPMQYDSAGVKYNFESSGMCEINAYKDNKAVFVNPAAKPQINLSTNNKNPLHNLYFLDTIAKTWKFTGKDIITEIKNTVVAKPGVSRSPSENIDHVGAKQIKIYSEGNDFPLVVKPLKPVKALEGHQAFSIAIDPGSFEELYAYDNVKFEVVDESTYKRSDADEHWNNVKLERSSTEGIYNITFTNTARKVTYKVRPVLQGADYDAALKVFNEKEKLYKQTLNSRLVKDQHETDSITSLNKRLQNEYNAANSWNDKMNALVAERNKRMKELWKHKMEEEEKRMQAERQMAEDRFLEIERNQAKYAMDMRLSAEVMRTFTINNFGVWNCDHPEYPDKEVPIVANYKDSLNNNLIFATIAVVYKGFNGITQFPSQMQIRVMPGQQNMIWTIKDSILYYFTYHDFTESGIVIDTKSFTFKMRKSEKPIASYDEIRAVMNKLNQ